MACLRGAAYAGVRHGVRSEEHLPQPLKGADEADDEIESLLCSSTVSAPSSCSTGVYSYLEKLKSFSEWNEDVKFIQRAMARKELRRQAASLRVTADDLGDKLAEMRASRARKQGRATAAAAAAPLAWPQRERRLRAAEAAEAVLPASEEDMCYWRLQLSNGLVAAEKTATAAAAGAWTSASKGAAGAAAEAGPAGREECTASDRPAKSMAGSEEEEEGREGPAGSGEAADEDHEAMWQARLELFWDHFDPWPAAACKTPRRCTVEEVPPVFWHVPTSEVGSPEGVSAPAPGAVEEPQHKEEARRGPCAAMGLCALVAVGAACLVPLFALQA